MPFIEPQDRTQNEEFKVKIRPEVKELIEQYAQFLNSEPSYVVQEVMRKVITGDKEFQRQKNPTPIADSPKKKAVA